MGSELTGVCSQANGYPGKTDELKQKRLENESGSGPVFEVGH